MSLIPSFERSYIVGRLAEATPEGGLRVNDPPYSMYPFKNELFGAI